MEELEHFADLNLDEDKDWSKENIVTHSEAGNRNRQVIIDDTDTNYEEVSMARWPNCVEEKRILDMRLRRLHDWKSFYTAMEDRTQRFVDRRVFEQCREFGASSGLPSTSSKRQKATATESIPYNASITSVAAGEEFSVMLVAPKQEHPMDGHLWTFSSNNFEKSNWRQSSEWVVDFQVAHIFRDVLWVVAGNEIRVYKLPRCELVYRIDVWETYKILLKQNVNTIRATQHTVSVVTRSRGFLVFAVIARTLELLKWCNTNKDTDKNYQYTTTAIFMDMLAFGRTDGIVEMWQIRTPDDADATLEKVMEHDWLEPVKTNSGALVEPTQGVPITCIAMSGPKIAISTEEDMVMIDLSPSNRTQCKLTKVATVVDMKIFGDMILVLSIDGGLSVGEFASGRTYCNTTRSIEDARLGCATGPWVFCTGDIAGALFPNGNINVLNHSSARH